jgi:hypothetical protein
VFLERKIRKRPEPEGLPERRIGPGGYRGEQDLALR